MLSNPVWLDTWIDEKCEKYYKTCDPFCCNFSDKYLVVTKEEAELFIQQGMTPTAKMSLDELKNHSFEEFTMIKLTNRIWPYAFKGGECPFVSERRCSIYYDQNRPDGCKSWPLYYDLMTHKLTYNLKCAIINIENISELNELARGRDRRLGLRLESLLKTLRERAI